jgi:glutamate dehydrogenase/leucine dehydrogenase
MALTKMTTTDAFVVTDIPDVPATGVVRMGKKILQSSAKDLARSATYSFAAFGIERSGASAGINAEGGAQADAVDAFVKEVLTIDGVHLNPGKGITAEQLAPLSAGRNADNAQQLTVEGIVTAASWAVGGSLSGITVAVEGRGFNPMADLVATGLELAGADVVTPGPDAKPWMIWGSEVDLLLAGTKPGTLTHQGAGMVKANAVVPWGPIPVTTKAYLMLERAGTRVLPDFVTAAAGLVAPYLKSGTNPVDAGQAVSSQTATILNECADHEDGVMMGAFVRAEHFLAAWTDYTPFGRPLAA